MTDFDWNPGTLLEMSGSYWKTCTLHAAVKLDIFTIMGSKKLTVDEINKKSIADTRGLSMLLNALCALELLVKDDDTYKNSPQALTFLSKSSEKYIGFMIMHHYHLMASWHDLALGIKTGKPVRDRSSFSDEERRESFLMGMFNIGMAVAPTVAEQLDLSGCYRILDFGGGPGTFAIHFCLANPTLKAVVYDLETTRPFAEKTIKKFNLSDRIDFVSGDFIKDDGLDANKFDAAWLSHILHGEGPEQAQQVIKKAVDSLKSGSKIFIHEFILEDTMDGPLFPALFSLNMFLGTPEGQAYSQSQLSDMLGSCGVKNITRHKFVGPTQSGILSGLTT